MSFAGQEYSSQNIVNFNSLLNLTITSDLRVNQMINP